MRSLEMSHIRILNCQKYIATAKSPWLQAAAEQWTSGWNDHDLQEWWITWVMKAINNKYSKCELLISSQIRSFAKTDRLPILSFIPIVFFCVFTKHLLYVPDYLLTTECDDFGSWTRSFKLSAQVIVQILFQVQYLKPFDVDKQSNHKQRSHLDVVGGRCTLPPNLEDIHHAEWNYWGLSASWGPIYRGNRQMTVTASPHMIYE